MGKFFIFIVVIFTVIVMSTNAQMTGGLGEALPIDDDVTALFEELKPEIVKKICDAGTGKCPTTESKFVLNNYKKQVVAGVNYFVSFTVDDSEVYHARIFHQGWSKTKEVHSVNGPKQSSEEISYF